MEDYSSRTTVDLVGEVLDDLRLLFRKELELARIEFVGGLKAQLAGAGLILGAAFALIPSLLFFAIGLALWLPVSAAVGFFIVGAAILGFAVIVALAGVGVMKARRPSVDTVVDSLKEDARWARGHLRR